MPKHVKDVLKLVLLIKKEFGQVKFVKPGKAGFSLFIQDLGSARNFLKPTNKPEKMKTGNYNKFALMLLASFIVMFLVMYANLASLDHFYLSTNKFYMTFLMITPMAVIMLAFMAGMYMNKKKNAAIVIFSSIIFIGFFILIRNQTFIDDKGYMKSMIPHHSSAILVSEKADLEDPEVRELAEQIIQAQREEIAKMKRILERMENEE